MSGGEIVSIIIASASLVVACIAFVVSVVHNKRNSKIAYRVYMFSDVLKSQNLKYIFELKISSNKMMKFKKEYFVAIHDNCAKIMADLKTYRMTEDSSFHKIYKLIQKIDDEAILAGNKLALKQPMWNHAKNISSLQKNLFQVIEWFYHAEDGKIKTRA